MDSENFKNGVEASEKIINIIKEFKGLFKFIKSMPQQALLKMQLVLKQIDDTVRAVDESIDKFIEAALEISNINETPSQLIELASTKLKTEIEHKRGHCTTISNIRWNYLNGWIDRQFASYPKESQMLNSLFDKLSDADDLLFLDLAKVSEFMQQTGKNALTLHMLGKVEESKRVIKEAAIELLNFKEQLSTAQSELIKLKNMFIKQMQLEQEDLLSPN